MSDLYISVCVWTVGVAGVLLIVAVTAVMLASAVNIIKKLSSRETPLPTVAVVTEAVEEQKLLPARRPRRSNVARCEKCRHELPASPTSSTVTDDVTILQFKCERCGTINSRLAGAA